MMVRIVDKRGHWLTGPCLCCDAKPFEYKDFEQRRFKSQVKRLFATWKTPADLKMSKRHELLINGLEYQNVKPFLCQVCRYGLRNAAKAVRRKQQNSFDGAEHKTLRAVRVVAYQQYTRSPYWKEVRAAKLAQVGEKCEWCDKTKSLTIHHLTYEHRGNELEHLDDLVVACRSCHFKKHGNNYRAA